MNQATYEVTNNPNQHIAGVTLAPISDGPMHHAGQERFDFPTILERRYQRAQQAFADQGYSPPQRGIWDDRFAELPVWDSNNPDAHGPHFNFLLDGGLLQNATAAFRAKGAGLSVDELAVLGLEQGEDAVSADFTTDAMNAINASYYASEIAFAPEAELATMFANNRPLNYALGALLYRNAHPHHMLRVKELCSGNNNDHWRYAALGALDAGAKQVDVTLSDFVRPLIDARSVSDRVAVSAEQYSLFEDMPDLPEHRRYDAMIATYGFDSVWQPEDTRLVKSGDQWYQVLYRVKVADWHPRRQELLDAMRRGGPLPDAAARDYDGIYVEEAMQPVDIATHPFGQYIADRNRKTINFPGGLIKRVVNAFASQLKPGGVFVSADVGDFGVKEKSVQPDGLISGVAARYKCEDYVLAKEILEKEYGFTVTLLGLDSLAGQYLPQGWQDNVSERERLQIEHNTDNGVMIVKRR